MRKTIRLLDLNDTTCRWPLGDPQQPGFGFCGCAVKDGSVYCAEHHARAYTGIPSKKPSVRVGEAA